MQLTKELYDRAKALTNTILTENQDNILYTHINSEYFSIVKPIFDKRFIIELQDTTYCEITEELNAHDINSNLNIEGQFTHVRVKQCEWLPDVYVNSYIRFTESKLLKQSNRNMQVLRGTGVSDVEVDTIEEIDLYNKFAFITSSFTIN